METGVKRTSIARLLAAFAFVCGVIGLYGGLTDHMWKMGAMGWFAGGSLLALLAMYALIDGAVAFEKTHLK